MESSYLDTTQQFEESKAILLSTRQNKYVYGFEHSLCFNNSDSKIVLKILDTDNDFENKFFNESFFEMLMNEQVSNFLKNKENISEFGNYFNKALNSQIRIFLAYGIGNELSNWSNPIACTLFGANIELANNGLRTYTYEFRPEVNYFFSYQSIDADQHNITENLSLSFGGGLIRTKVENFVGKNKFKKVTKNISDLLTKFVSKITNTPETNVITLLPDLDKNLSEIDITVSSLNTEQQNYLIQKKLDFKQQAALAWDDMFIWDSQDTVAENIKVDWKNEIEVILFYRKYFKNIQVLKPNAVNCVKIFATNKISKSPLKEELLSELNSRLVEERKKAQESLEKDQEAESILNQKIQTLQDQRAQIANNLKYTPDTNRARRDKLLADAREVDNRLKETKLKLNEARAGNRKVKGLSDSKIESIENSILDVETENGAGLLFTLVSEPDPNQSKDSQKPELPDWYKTLQNVFLGVASLYEKGDSAVSPHISYESDSKFLKLFHQYGMISDPTIPCVIVGDRQMVLDYIYKNQVTLSEIPNIVSKFKLNKDDKLYDILTKKDYAISLRDMIRKKKNSSSFGEKIMLDELFLDKETRELSEKYTESEDIPVFLNNLKNSNVLSYSVKNTENYVVATRMGVRENRFKTLLAQLSKDKLSEVLKIGGITEEGKLTPVDIANILFSESVKKITQLGFNENEKLSANVVSLYNLSLQLDKDTDLMEQAMDDFYVSVDGKYEDRKKSYNTNYEKLNEKDRQILDILISIKNQRKSDPYIFSNSQENVTLINALLQAQITEKYPLIPPESVLPLAETIVLMNAANVASNNSQVEILPAAYLPNKNYILGKITEYAMKYFIEISIKTLPFFYLSNYRVISQPALFYSKKINTSNYGNFDTFDFFSGDYRILGFRHVITTRECYSEFLLNKNNALGGELKSI
jgi:hypothetical protein